MQSEDNDPSTAEGRGVVTALSEISPLKCEPGRRSTASASRVSGWRCLACKLDDAQEHSLYCLKSRLAVAGVISLRAIHQRGSSFQELQR